MFWIIQLYSLKFVPKWKFDSCVILFFCLHFWYFFVIKNNCVFTLLKNYLFDRYSSGPSLKGFIGITLVLHDPFDPLVAGGLSSCWVCCFLSDLLDVPQCDQPPAFARSLDDLGVGVAALGEVLVAAAIAAGAHLRVALILQHAVQTLRLEATRPLVWRLAVALGDLGDVGRKHLNLPNWLVDLES